MGMQDFLESLIVREAERTRGLVTEEAQKTRDNTTEEAQKIRDNTKNETDRTIKAIAALMRVTGLDMMRAAGLDRAVQEVKVVAKPLPRVLQKAAASLKLRAKPKEIKLDGDNYGLSDASVEYYNSTKRRPSCE